MPEHLTFKTEAELLAAISEGLVQEPSLGAGSYFSEVTGTYIDPSTAYVESDQTERPTTDYGIDIEALKQESVRLEGVREASLASEAVRVQVECL
jgi:hypothetical protein